MSTERPATAPRKSGRRFGLGSRVWLLLILTSALAWWCDRRELAAQVARSETLCEAQRLAPPDQVARHRDVVAVLDWMRQGPDIASGDSTVKALPEFSATYQIRPPSDEDTGDDEAEASHQVARAEIDRAVGALLALLHDADPSTRARAAFSLGLIGPNAHAAAAALRQAACDDDRRVRWHAVFALGRLGPDADSAAMLRRIMHDDRSDMPAFAAQRLRKIDPQANVVPRLQELLTHVRPDTRRRAVEELRSINDDAARAAWPAVRPLLADPDREVREAAMWAVDTLAPADEAVPAMVEAFRSESDESLRHYAAVILISLDSSGEDAP